MKIKLAVIFGGKSPEHEISVISALQTIHAADTNRYDITPIYISKQGVWFTGEALMNVKNYKDTPKLLAQCEKLLVSVNSDEGALYKYPSGLITLKQKLGTIDLVLPVLHGAHGEDGVLQGFLELMNIPYAGCNLLASAIGMDKITMKIVFRHLGLAVVDFQHFYSKDWINTPDMVIDNVEKSLGYPVIVKPADLGSSIGISKAKDRAELREAIDNAVQFSRKVIVEKAIVNLKEVNCAVLGDYETAIPSICEEPVVNNDKILSYNEKYVTKSGSKGMASLKRKIPADITDTQTATIQDMAVRSFQGLDCSGASRIDFLIDQDNGNIYVNEINTIPGSLSFYLWEKTGISFTELVDRLVALAQKKQREKNNLNFSFDSNIFQLNGVKLGGKKG